jgi:hypothetical protein
LFTIHYLLLTFLIINFQFGSMQVLIGDVISRVRREIKAVRQDAFLSDRFLYSLLVKHGNWLMKREDGANKLLRFDSIVQSLPYVGLVEVDAVEACCRGIESGCVIKRTRDPLPELFDGYAGPLFRAVTSLDGTQEVVLTDPITYVHIRRQSSRRYNKSIYGWFLNGYLFFPNLEWDAVRIEGVFSGDVNGYGCDDCSTCVLRQEQVFNVPGYLHGELESQVMNDLKVLLSVPGDDVQDKKSLTR